MSFSFCEARITGDLEALNIPIKYKRVGMSMAFELEIITEIYEGTYHFTLEFPQEYPFKGPKLMCNTRVYHPNIDSEGHVCLKVLREGWLPSFDINSIVVSLLCMFEYVNGEDALNTEAGMLFDQDYNEFIRRVKRGY